MSGYVILGGFVVLAISHAAMFFTGFRKGLKKAEADFNEALRRKAEGEVKFEKEKAKIMGEVFGDAENKKASLSRGTARERFDRANSVLRGNPES
jgi:hypothetical protein